MTISELRIFWEWRGSKNDWEKWLKKAPETAALPELEPGGEPGATLLPPFWTRRADGEA